MVLCGENMGLSAAPMSSTHSLNMFLPSKTKSHTVLQRSCMDILYIHTYIHTYIHLLRRQKGDCRSLSVNIAGEYLKTTAKHLPFHIINKNINH